MTKPKFIIVPGDLGSKVPAKRRTRLYLPSGHEIKGLDTMTVEACEPTIFHADGHTQKPKNRLSTITLNLGPSDVSIRARPPKKATR